MGVRIARAGRVAQHNGIPWAFGPGHIGASCIGLEEVVEVQHDLGV